MKDEVFAGEQIDEENQRVGSVLDELHKEVRRVRRRPEEDKERGDVEDSKG